MDQKISKNILISGSTGFIGSTLMRLDNQNQYFAISNNQKVKTKKWISSTASLDELIRFIQENDIDTILHLATEFIRDDDLSRLNSVLTANYDLPTRLICAACESNVTKFVYAGSSWEKDIRDNNRPRNLYAAVKKSFDPIAYYYSKSGDLQIRKLTLFDTYGPFDRRNKIVDLIIKSKEKPLILNTPNQKINLTHSYDVCSAIICALDHRSTVNKFQEYMVRSAKSATIIELVQLIETLISCKLNINFRDTDVIEEFIPETNLRYIPGWLPKFSLVDGLKDKLITEGKLL